MFARLNKWLWCVAVVILVGCHSASTRLIFLQVGQGDCAIFTTGGTTVLIDVGPRDAASDAGERFVLPALRKYGIEDVDLILLSHPDQDHVGGLRAIHRAFPNAKIGISAQFKEWSSMLFQLKYSEIKPEEVMWIPAEQTMKLGDFDAKIVCPSMEGRENDNDGSMLVRLSNGPCSAVFMGDAPSDVEDAQTGDWTAAILKAGHHGSRNSTSTAWLKMVKPQIVILSCGRDNQFGHPHKDTVQRIQEFGAKIWRTDWDGDAVFEPGSTGWQQILSHP